MQANRSRSMVEAKLNSHKTVFKFEISNLRLRRTPCGIYQRAVVIGLLWVLITAPHVLLAQQSPATQPCSLQPCTEQKISAPPRRDTRKRFSKILIDERIPKDPTLERMTKPYSAKVRALETIIGKLEADLIKGEVGAGTLG